MVPGKSYTLNSQPRRLALRFRTVEAVGEIAEPLRDSRFCLELCEVRFWDECGRIRRC